MAERRIEIMQENASGVFAVVAVTPTAAKNTLSFNGSGVPVAVAAGAHITDAAVAVADPVPKAEYDLLVAKFNAVLVALENANIVNNS